MRRYQFGQRIAFSGQLFRFAVFAVPAVVFVGQAPIVARESAIWLEHTDHSGEALGLPKYDRRMKRRAIGLPCRTHGTQLQSRRCDRSCYLRRVTR